MNDESLAQAGKAIGDAMNRVVYGARTIPAGTTVGDFLDAMFQAGVKLDEPLSSIEFGVRSGNGSIVVCRDESGGVHIGEAR